MCHPARAVCATLHALYVPPCTRCMCHPARAVCATLHALYVHPARAVCATLLALYVPPCSQRTIQTDHFHPAHDQILTAALLQARRRSAQRLVEEQKARLKVHSDRLKALEQARQRLIWKRRQAEGKDEDGNEVVEEVSCCVADLNVIDCRVCAGCSIMVVFRRERCTSVDGCCGIGSKE
jgi:hypothetical protein